MNFSQKAHGQGTYAPLQMKRVYVVPGFQRKLEAAIGRAKVNRALGSDGLPLEKLQNSTTAMLQDSLYLGVWQWRCFEHFAWVVYQ